MKGNKIVKLTIILNMSLEVTEEAFYGKTYTHIRVHHAPKVNRTATFKSRPSWCGGIYNALFIGRRNDKAIKIDQASRHQTRPVHTKSYEAPQFN